MAYEKALKDEYAANLPADIAPIMTPIWTQAERLHANLATIKATNLMQRRGMICSCIKVSYGGGASILGYLYSEVFKAEPAKIPHGGGIVYGGDSDDDGWFARYMGGNAPDEFEHRHLCYGPTYASMDGEFRGRLIQWNQMLKFFTVYEELCDEIEKVAVVRMEAREMSFQVDICYPDGFTGRDEFEESVNLSRVCIRMFVLCWLVDMYEIYFGIDANHMNPGYYAKIFTEEESFHFEHILNKVCPRLDYRRAIHDATKITESMKGSRLRLNPQVGQKIFSMSIMEAATPWNLNFPFWRELYSTKKCAELVLSLLTPSHPLLIDWFYVTNTHAGIFETLSSHERFAHSEQAAKIDARLKDIDDATHIDAVRANAYVSGKFKGMSQEIWGAIHYGETFIELTNTTVGMIIEHVGFTLADLPSHIVETAYVSYGGLFSDFRTHARLQFEYLLALYQMHRHCGIIHADLHYNNCTVFEMFRLVKEGKLLSEGNEMGYYLRGKLYSFPFNGLFGCIIDMSRSVLGINRGKLIDEFGEFPTDTFLRNQRDYVMEVIAVYFGEFVEKYRAELRRALDDHMEVFLRVASAVDVLCVGENILRLAREPLIETGTVKSDKRVVTLAAAISKRARELFVDGMSKIIAGDTTKIGYPAIIVIEELFSEFVVTAPAEYYKGVKLNDVINADGEFDKTLERGLKSWNYCNPEEAMRLRALDGKGMPQEYLDLIAREKRTPFVVKPDEKLGGNELAAGGEIAEWMYV